MFQVNSPSGRIGFFNSLDDAVFFAYEWMQDNHASAVISCDGTITCVFLCKQELKERVSKPAPNTPKTLWGKVLYSLSGASQLVKAKKQLERQRLRHGRLANELERERNRTLALQEKLSDLSKQATTSYTQNGVDLPFSS